MKIGDLAERSGLTTHTIRYYERIGLLPRAPRGRSKQREYDASILPWIEFLWRLKITGMPIRDMVRYANLRARGTMTADERKALLVQHRQRLSARIDELQLCLSVLDTKIAGYEQEGENYDADTEQRRESVRARPARTRRH